MFGLFRSKPPLSASRRAEIEMRMRSILRRRNLEQVRQTEILESLDAFEIEVLDSEESIRALVQSITTSQNLDLDALEIELLPAPTGTQPSASYSSEADALTVVGTGLPAEEPFIVQLVVCLAERSVTRQPESQQAAETMTWELLAVLWGFGVPLAHNIDSEQPRQAKLNASQFGHLSSRDIGYALALMARIQKQASPRWAIGLRPETQKTFRQAMKTFPADAVMLIDARDIPTPESDATALGAFLDHRDETFRYVATTLLHHLEGAGREQAPKVIPMLGSRDEATQLAAIAALENMGEEAVRAKSQLEVLLDHPADPVAVAASKALMTIEPSDFLFGTIGDIMEARWSAAIPLADALSAHQKNAADAAPSVCRRLVSAVRRTEDDVIEALLACLHEIHDAPTEVLKDTIDDDEMLSWVREYLNHQSSEQEPFVD